MNQSQNLSTNLLSARHTLIAIADTPGLLLSLQIYTALHKNFELIKYRFSKHLLRG